VKNINDVISEMKIDELKDSKIQYGDELSIEQSDIDKNFSNYWTWKYYTGKITEPEHNFRRTSLGETESIVQKVYMCIFCIRSYKNEWYNNKKIIDLCYSNSNELYQDFSNEVMDLWLMRPYIEFEYEDEFRKLIFMLYLVKNDKRFRTISLDFYKTNEEAKKYVEEHNIDKSTFLICLEEEKDFNRTYGIKEETILEENWSNVMQRQEETTQGVEDWITQKFGGVN